MRFHGNQLSWAIKHHFISLYSKYQSPGFIYQSTMLAPVISSLDEIYCINNEIAIADRSELIKCRLIGLRMPINLAGNAQRLMIAYKSERQ